MVCVPRFQLEKRSAQWSPLIGLVVWVVTKTQKKKKSTLEFFYCWLCLSSHQIISPPLSADGGFNARAREFGSRTVPTELLE